MLAAIKNAIVEYLKSQIAPDKPLFGVKSVVSGRLISQSIPTIVYPTISVYVDNSDFDIPYGGNSPIRLAAKIYLELMTASLKRMGDAEDECLRLVLSDDGSKGLVKALQLKPGFQVNGQGFLASINEQNIRFVIGTASTDGFTMGAIVPLAIQTTR